MQFKISHKAFTLIELIVVITILAILGTIAFITLQNYSKDARDAKRISDVKSLINKLNIESAGGGSFANYLTGTAIHSVEINGDEYDAVQGVLDFEKLRENRNNFLDPRYYTDYEFAASIGTTTYNSQYHKFDFVQGRTISEKDGNTEVLLGNYYQYQSTDSPNLFTGSVSLVKCGDPDKETVTPEGYTITQTASNGMIIQAAKTEATPNGENIYTQGYRCNNGTYETSGDEKITTICNAGYLPREDYTCEEDMCKGEIPDNGLSTATTQSREEAWRYNEIPGMCSYKCEDNYTHSPELNEETSITTSYCRADCTDVQTIDGYTLEPARHNQTQAETPSKEIEIQNGSQTATQDFKCINGTQTKFGDEIRGGISCNHNYTLTTNSESGEQTCEPNEQTNQTCNGLVANAIWTSSNMADSKTITQIWNGTTWSPTTIGSYNAEDADADKCFFKCKENYTYNGAGCIANTKEAQTCTDLPANAVWTSTNADSSKNITQTWDGTTWGPTLTGEYNPTETAPNFCYFQCKTNYTYNSETNTCTAGMQDAQACLNLPENAIWNTVDKIKQTWDGAQWSPTLEGAYNETPSTTGCHYKCKENYTWNAEAKICVADTKTFTCAAKPADGTQWNTVSSYTQTWNGTAWVPADSSTAYNALQTTTACHYTCAAGYVWNTQTTSCVANTRTNQACTGIPNTTAYKRHTATITQTTTDGLTRTPNLTGAYSATAVTGECRYTCNTGYAWTGSACEIIVNGACNTTSTITATAPTGQANLCTAGTASPTTATASGNNWSWTCKGINTGTDKACTRPRAYCATQPSYANATFTTGTPTASNQAWAKGAANCGFTCKAGYTGDTCELQIINGACNTTSTITAVAPSGQANLCTAGTANPTTATANGNNWSWTCKGINTGTDKACTRPRAYCATQPSYANATFTTGTPTASNQSWTLNGSGGCYYTCKANYSGTNCATYTPPAGVTTSGNDLIVSDGTNSITIADRNVGATSNTYTATTSYGNHYQWGRNNTGWTNGNSSWNYDWQTPQVNNAWGGASDTLTSTAAYTSARQGPCDSGYHVPSVEEWKKLISIWFTSKGQTCTSSSCSWTGTATLANFQSELKIPLAGFRDRSNGTVYGQGSMGYYWSSSPNGTDAFRMYFGSSSVHPQYDSFRAYGYSIRCFKN